MHDEPTFGSQVRQGPPPRASRRARRWPRLLVFAFLAVVMLIALGGTSKASELDPNETVTDALDPVVETVTNTMSVAAIKLLVNVSVKTAPAAVVSDSVVMMPAG